MKLTGTLKLADDTLIQFFPNGEIMRSVKKKHSRVTKPEAMMYINNSPSYTHASKSYEIDGKLVTYAAFVAQLASYEPPAPTIADEDYVEQYTEHTPLHIQYGFEDMGEEQMEIDVSVEIDKDEDDKVAVVVDPQETGDWFA